MEPPAPIKAASPPEDPPGVLISNNTKVSKVKRDRADCHLVLSWGFAVLPYTGLLQLQDSMVWGMLVRQKGTPCSSFIPATKLQSWPRGWSMNWARPIVLS